MPTEDGAAQVQPALIASAAQFADTAIGAYLDEQYEVFLLHAATSAEHLLKASLCQRSPALIAEAGDRSQHFRSLTTLLGLEVTDVPRRARVATTRHSVRTIGANDALQRVGAFIPRLSGGRERDGLAELFGQRNGVVHLGDVAARDEALNVRGPFITASALLLKDLEQDPAGFWGRNHGTAARWAKDAQDEADQAVQDLLESSRRRFRLRWGSLFPQDVEQRRSAERERLQRRDPVSEAVVDCPACGMPCLVTGYPADSASEDDSAYDLEVELLQCDMCGLALIERDDVKRAGVPVQVPLPDVDEDMIHQYYDDAQADSEADWQFMLDPELDR